MNKRTTIYICLLAAAFLFEGLKAPSKDLLLVKVSGIMTVAKSLYSTKIDSKDQVCLVLEFNANSGSKTVCRKTVIKNGKFDVQFEIDKQSKDELSDHDVISYKTYVKMAKSFWESTEIIEGRPLLVEFPQEIGKTAERSLSSFSEQGRVYQGKLHSVFSRY